MGTVRKANVGAASLPTFYGGDIRPRLHGPGQFCTDEFCPPWNAGLHGSVQILLKIALAFTRLRANFKTSVVFALFFFFC